MILLISLMILTSCMTINRSRYIDGYTDENGKNWSVWKTEKYNRKTKELISTTVDTLETDKGYTSTTILK